MNIDNNQITGNVRNPEEYKVPWSIRDTWLGVSFIFIWLLILSLFAFFLPDLDATLFLALGEALLVLPVWWFGVRKKSWTEVGIKKFSASALGLGCGLMLFSWLINLVYSFFLMLFDLQIQPDLTPLFSELASPAWIFIIGVILAPLVEELFFRGFILQVFDRNMVGKEQRL